jgi:multidrug resistance efflux pump
MKSPDIFEAEPAAAAVQVDAPRLTPKSQSHAWRIAALCASFILIIIAALLFLFPNPRSNRTSRSTAHIQTSSSIEEKTIRLTGTTEAVQTRAIVVPILSGEHFAALTVTKLIDSGAHVRTGQVLAEFDRQSQIRAFIDKQAEYENLANKVLQEQAKESAARAKDETEIGQAESSLTKAQLEMQKLELMSRIDAEKAQETLEEAKATLEQLRATFQLKRQAAHAAIRLLAIQRDREGEVMKHAQANTELMQIRSPIDGVVVLKTIWKEGKMGQVQEGDQVRPGVAFMDVVDPSKMEVRALVNQEDFLKLQFGKTATVRLDAYPELSFPGRLEEMAPIASTGDFSAKLHRFAVVFSIAGSNPKLMPDLSAMVDLDLTTQAGGSGAF